MGSAVLVLAVGWSAGIAVGVFVSLPGLVVLVGPTATIGAAVLAPSARERLLAIALAAFLLGMGRADHGRAVASPDPLESYAGDVVLSGRVVEAPVPRGSRLEAVIEVDGVAQPGAASSSVALGTSRPRVLLRATFLRAAYGDRIETRGRLSRPRSRPGWPLEEILARRQISWVVDAGGARVVEPARTALFGLLAEARGLFEANARAALPEPHASLVAGIVFGSRVGLPPELRQAMAATGTSHLTAVSGANVAMVAGGLIFIATGLVNRLPASLFVMAGVWLYTLLVGAPPSALRAATMATFALAARGLGRESDAIAGLALAVAVLLGWDPGLAFDLSFQLSATATAGLILLAPSIERWLSWLPVWIRGHVAVAVAAQIATLPLIVGTFQRLSLVSLPANVLAAPTIVPIMGLGALIAVLGSVPGVDVVIGWPAWLMTGALLAVIETASRLPGGVVGVGRSPAWLPVAWYAVLACWVASGSADVKALGIRPVALKLAAILGLGAMVTLAILGEPGSGRTEGVQVVLLDAEPAAALVRTPSGGTALLTTSTASRGIAASVGAHLHLLESVVDVEFGPVGMRTAVDLLELAAERHASDALEHTVEGFGVPGDSDAGGDGPTVGLAVAVPTAVSPGLRIDLGDGVEVQVVDVRLVGERPVADLVVMAEGVAILLPGPGSPSTRWSDVAPEAVSIAVLPSSAVSWARTLPRRYWLLLVGEPALAWAQRESAVPFLERREYGAIELTLVAKTIGVRAERCRGGRGCAVDLPTPVFRTLLAGASVDSSSNTTRPQVQSGRSGDDH